MKRLQDNLSGSQHFEEKIDFIHYKWKPFIRLKKALINRK